MSFNALSGFSDILDVSRDRTSVKRVMPRVVGSKSRLPMSRIDLRVSASIRPVVLVAAELILIEVGIGVVAGGVTAARPVGGVQSSSQPGLERL